MSACGHFELFSSSEWVERRVGFIRSFSRKLNKTVQFTGNGPWVIEAEFVGNIDTVICVGE